MSEISVHAQKLENKLNIFHPKKQKEIQEGIIKKINICLEYLYTNIQDIKDNESPIINPNKYFMKYGKNDPYRIRFIGTEFMNQEEIIELVKEKLNKAGYFCEFGEALFDCSRFGNCQREIFSQFNVELNENDEPEEINHNKLSSTPDDLKENPENKYGKLILKLKESDHVVFLKPYGTHKILGNVKNIFDCYNHVKHTYETTIDCRGTYILVLNLYIKKPNLLEKHKPTCLGDNEKHKPTCLGDNEKLDEKQNQMVREEIHTFFSN